MSVSGIQGLPLEVTVVGCNKLKDTEWFSRQDPYVCIEYGSSRFRTRTCTDGGKTPTFQEKFTVTLIEGLRDLSVLVWNSNTISTDDFIGSGKVNLQKVLSQGYDDTAWTVQTKTGRYAGEVRLILHYGNAHKPATSYGPSAPPHAAPPMPQSSLYSHPPPPSSAPHPHHSSAYTTSAPAPYTAYPPNGGGYPPSSYPRPPPPSTYPPNGGGYPPSSYPPPPPPSTYPPQPYPPTSTYPPSSAYPPTSTYPPSQYPPQYPPPGPFPGLYPPRPY